MIKTLYFIIVFVVSTSCHGTENHPIDLALDQCLSLEESMSTSAMSKCTIQAKLSWEKELILVYEKLMLNLNSEARKSMMASQKSWLKYKELEVESINAVYANLDGTMYIPMRQMDLLMITKSRVLDLNNYLFLLSNHATNNK